MHDRAARTSFLMRRLGGSEHDVAAASRVDDGTHLADLQTERTLLKLLHSQQTETTNSL
jgi:hypothetical protein